jgi:uncharacterized protein
LDRVFSIFVKSRKHSLALIGVLAFVCAQQSVIAQAQRATSTEARHCLWRIEGQTNTVFLLGSMHFLKKEHYPLPKPIEDAYQKSQTVIFEADIEEMQSPAVQAKFAKEGRIADGETLKQKISKQTYARLQTYLAGALGSPSVFDTLTPWMAAVALAEIELQRLGYRPEDGIDIYFSNKAIHDGKKIQGFERVDFQIGLFTGLSKADQEEMLKQALDDADESKAMLADITDSWMRGDTKKMEKLLLETFAAYPEIEKKLLLDRNKRWIPTIEKLLGSGQNGFIVVGTAHLVGKGSVVDLLAKKGLKIQQL